MYACYTAMKPKERYERSAMAMKIAVEHFGNYLDYYKDMYTHKEV
jgi:hypothetical protein